MKEISRSSQGQPIAIGSRKRPLTFHHAVEQVWHLVHCKPNSEQLALRNLENQKFPAFLPLQKLTSRKGNAFHTRLRPLFPGYLFVAQGSLSGEWHKINNTRGVARLVCNAANPSPVPSAIMNQLFERCDEGGIFQPLEDLINGDNVKISQGPFSGTVGKIIEIEPNQRVHLLLDFMGQKSSLEIDRAGVSPIT